MKRNSNTDAASQPSQSLASRRTIPSLPSAFTILIQAWSIYKQRFGTLLGVMIIPALIIFALPVIFPVPDDVSLLIISAILLLVIMFISHAWGQTALLYAIKDSQKGVGIIESYQRGWRNILSYSWLLLLLGFITFCGFLLLVVPGIIFSVWFSLAIFILIAEDLKGTDALLKSKEYVKGKWVSVFWRFLFIGLLSLILSIVLVLISRFLEIPFSQEISRFVIGLFLTPLVTIYSFLVYSNLKTLKGEFVFSPIGRKKPPLFLVVPLFLVIFISASFGIGIYIGKQRGIASCPICPPEDVDFSLFWQAWRSLEEKFVDSGQLNEQEMIYGAISGMVESIGDTYTVFFDPEETKEFIEEAQGVFEGIGAEIGIKNDQLLIVAPLEGAPAEKAGLLAGDKIMEIEGASTVGMTVEKAVSLIRGPKGTKATLTILREGWVSPKEIKIVRGLIEIPTLKWEIIEGDIVHLKVYQFTEKGGLHFRKAALDILASPAQKIILDLRNNPGGYLQVAQEISGWLLDKDDIFTLEARGGEIMQEHKAEGPAKLIGYPIVVLINQGSASASEILAASLRDNRQVSLIGENSFGKGLVQELIDLRDGSSLKITITEWLTPKGESINEVGLEPDIKIEMTEKDYEEDKDPQLDKAIEVIKGL